MTRSLKGRRLTSIPKGTQKHDSITLYLTEFVRQTEERFAGQFEQAPEVLLQELAGEYGYRTVMDPIMWFGSRVSQRAAVDDQSIRC